MVPGASLLWGGFFLSRLLESIDKDEVVADAQCIGSGEVTTISL